MRSLAVMMAMERWFQMDAAILLDAQRDRCGIGGGDAGTPDWWVTCEYQGVDIWLERPNHHGVAIELKAIHNNKNFYTKVLEVRSDLTPEMKPVPSSVPHVERVGLVVVTYVRYAKEHSGRYMPLRSSRRGPHATC